MTDNIYQENSSRRKRVNRLKRWIIGILITSILIPNICVVLLFCKVTSLNGTLSELSARMEQLQLQLEEKSMQEQENILNDSVAPVSADGVAQSDEGQASVDVAHKVYLTFDDGPGIYTNEILDILAEYDVKATFFVNGKEDTEAKESLKRIVEEGHSLGMHSYSHEYTEIYESAEDFEADLEKIQAYIYDNTGIRSDIYRFPGGSSNTISETDMRELAECLEEKNITFFDWNISSGDGTSKPLTIEMLVENSTKDISRFHTSIVLMHDAAEKHTTVEALPHIIETIQAMENTVILPITEDTVPIQHIQ
ncbi:MAG: polysaccharide deacetylase [Lachnospiraceae bacterium]|nr:polysaccharide deacetylase [Lachnospiraceae bacterium]